MEKKALGNKDMQFGKAIAIAELVDCMEVTNEKLAAWRDMSGTMRLHLAFIPAVMPGYSLVRRIEPGLAKGRQRLWEWE